MMRALWARVVRGGRAIRRSVGSDDEAALAADRGVTFAKRSRSLQSRMSSFLAVGLVAGIAAMALAWYYGASPQSGAAVASAQGARTPVGVAGPPPLGPLPAPSAVAERKAEISSAAGAQAVRGVRRPGRLGLVALVPPTRPRPWLGMTEPDDQRQPMPHVTRRQFGGEVFIAAGSPAADAVRARVPSPVGRTGMRREPGPGGDSALRRLLHARVMSATRAQVLPQQRLLLAKGTFIDCTLETAIDSTLPGMTTCITATDTFSANGTVVLLPRGTQLIGQTRGRVRQGMARVFVIWTQARTPSGVVVTLNSPSTDALGRSGLSGKVNRHFWERFGAALLVSTLTGVIQSRVESANGTVIVDPTAGEEVLAQTLRANEDIAPTITVPNGKRIEVLVARDIDFRPVYALVER
jgi:type IV secretion system protein VirB10